MASVSEIRIELEKIEQSFIRSVDILTGGQWCDHVVQDVESLEAARSYEERPRSLRMLSGERMIC